MKKGLLTKALSFLTAVCILTGSADLSVFAMEAGGGESVQVEGNTFEDIIYSDLTKSESMSFVDTATVNRAAVVGRAASDSAFAVLYSAGILDLKPMEVKAAEEEGALGVMGAAAVSRAAAADGEAYAILYSDGTMVFQRGNTPDTSHGDVMGTYTGFETATYANMYNVPWHSNRSSVQSVIFKDSIKPVSIAEWFHNFNTCKSIDLTLLDTSLVTNMAAVFQNCSLSAIDLSHFDTRNVTNMENMFGGCRNLTSLDLSHFNTQNVTNMAYMFDSCRGLTTLDLSNFNTSNVTSMSGMFSLCDSLTSLNISSFDIHNVINMSGIFNYCESIPSLDVSQRTDPNRPSS